MNHDRYAAATPFWWTVERGYLNEPRSCAKINTSIKQNEPHFLNVVTLISVVTVALTPNE